MCFLRRHLLITSSSAIPTRAPITIPAIAPPDRGEDELDAEPEDGCNDVWLDALDTVEDVVIDDDSDEAKVEIEVVVVLEDVWVAAINFSGLKVQELANGAAELKDEYVSLSTWLLILVSVSWAELKQMLI